MSDKYLKTNLCQIFVKRIVKIIGLNVCRMVQIEVVDGRFIAYQSECDCNNDHASSNTNDIIDRN